MTPGKQTISPRMICATLAPVALLMCALASEVGHLMWLDVRVQLCADLCFHANNRQQLGCAEAAASPRVGPFCCT